MEFTIFTAADTFSAVVEPHILEQEDVFSLFLGVLHAIRQGKYENPFMATVEEEGELLAIVQMTPPHPVNLIIIEETRIDKIVPYLIKQLRLYEIDIPGVISKKVWAKTFANEWAAVIGEKELLLMEQGLYRLDEVNEKVEMSSGSWRFAVEEDCTLIEKWYSLFEEDANLPKSEPQAVQERVSTFVKEREVFLWENEGKVVSMMKKARPTKNSVTVSLVFTPEEERKKGYARTLVMLGSKELLKHYDYCVLYTDMLNPTSNKIYQEIGYRKIADSVHIGFVK